MAKMSERIKILKANRGKLQKAQKLVEEVEHVALSDEASRAILWVERSLNDAINECDDDLYEAGYIE